MMGIGIGDFEREAESASAEGFSHFCRSDEEWKMKVKKKKEGIYRSGGLITSKDLKTDGWMR